MNTFGIGGDKYCYKLITKVSAVASSAHFHNIIKFLWWITNEREHSREKERKKRNHQQTTMAAATDATLKRIFYEVKSHKRRDILCQYYPNYSFDEKNKYTISVSSNYSENNNKKHQSSLFFRRKISRNVSYYTIDTRRMIYSWRYYHNYLYDESYNRTILLPSKYSIKNNNKYDRSLFSLHREISKNASYCIIDNAYITDSETNNSYLIIKHPNTVNVPSFCSLMIYMFLATSYLILSHIIFIATIISHVVLFKSQLLR